jgi:hypothetical protein
MVILPAISTLVGTGKSSYSQYTVENVMVFVPTVLGFIALDTEIQLGVRVPPVGSTVTSLTITFFVLALVSQLSTTLLIIYRIIHMAQGQTYKYARVLEMVIESAAPNCLILMALFPFFVDPSLNAAYPQAIFVQFTVSASEKTGLPRS